MKRMGYPVVEPLQKIEVTDRGRGDWAREVTVAYGPQGKTRTVPGVDFRSALGLPSHKILSIVRVPGGWSVDGAGWGHGVGMCQWGTLEMGRRGFSETDMLRYYYPGASFTRVY
jgi:SpoIID/LytB domain protein